MQAFCLLINYCYGGEVALVEEAPTAVDAGAADAHPPVVADTSSSSSPSKLRRLNSDSPPVPPSFALSDSAAASSDCELLHLGAAPPRLSVAIAAELLARDACNYFALHSEHLARVCAAVLRRAEARAQVECALQTEAGSFQSVLVSVRV